MNKKKASSAKESQDENQGTTEWVKVAELDELGDGRVKTVVAGRKSLALSRIGDKYGALDNHCPHQGGPMGEGSIEKGWLRCPWHGYDYDPLTGKPPPPLGRISPVFRLKPAMMGSMWNCPRKRPPEGRSATFWLRLCRIGEWIRFSEWSGTLIWVLQMP